MGGTMNLFEVEKQLIDLFVTEKKKLGIYISFA